MGVLFVRGKAGWGLSSRINWIISWSWSLLSSGWGGWRTGPCAAPGPGGGGPCWAGRYTLDTGLCQALRTRDCV